MENNHELVQKYQELVNLERERASLEAGIDWTWKLGGDYGYASERIDTYGPIESGDNLVLPWRWEDYPEGPGYQYPLFPDRL